LQQVHETGHGLGVRVKVGSQAGGGFCSKRMHQEGNELAKILGDLKVMEWLGKWSKSKGIWVGRGDTLRRNRKNLKWEKVRRHWKKNF